MSNHKEGTFYDSTVVMYRRKLDVFFEYLIDIHDISDQNYNALLRGIGTDEITSAIEYYVRRYNINFQTTVDSFFTVIKGYFEFISSSLGIFNENFDSTVAFNKLSMEVDSTIDALKLSKSKQKYPINYETFVKLVNYCDEKISKFSIESVDLIKLRTPNSKNRPFYLFISAVMTKLVMLTGVKNQVISTINILDFDLKLNKIKVNNYWIHLPDKLGLDIRKYLILRERLIKNQKSTDALFVDKFGQAFTTEYTIMFDIVKDIVGNNKVENISKFTIVELIKKGINTSILQELTSFGDDTIIHCQEIVDEFRSGEDMKAKNRYIDSKIRGMGLYDIL